MYRELTRAMNDRERAVLEEILDGGTSPVTLGGTIRWVAVCLAGLIICGLATALLIWLEVHPILGGAIGGVITVVGIIFLHEIILGITSHFDWRRYHQEFVRDVIPIIREGLSDGRVHVKSIAATSVVEIREYEDEGSGYIYCVGNGRLLFLKGQAYCPIEEDVPWPNSEFEIVRTVFDDLWVGIFCHGVELTPERIIEMNECRDQIVWEDREELIDGEFMEHANSLINSPKNAHRIDT